MQMTFDFSDPRPVVQDTDSNDYHKLPPSDKQQRFALQIATRLSVRVPEGALTDRHALSEWIEAHKGDLPPARATSRFSNYPSSKQVAFAERIARIKRRAVPHACFKDRTMMSRWIDSNR